MDRAEAIKQIELFLDMEKLGGAIEVALKMAITALREQVSLENGKQASEKKTSDWISVEECLPKYNTLVLVYRPTMATKILVAEYEGYYGEDDNEWYEGWSAFGYDVRGKGIITHWMPPAGATEGGRVMAKQSGYVKRLQAKKAADITYHRTFTMQWCADAAILAANEVFQRKGEKIVEFHNAFIRYAHEIAEMTMEDAKADKSLVYTKAKLDERLEAILGKDFIPWDERYDFLGKKK